MNTQNFIRVRNTDVLELVRKGHKIYDENMELLDYGTDRIQPDDVYVTPCAESHNSTKIMCINHDTKMTQIICIVNK